MGWGGSNHHGAEHIAMESTLASPANTEVPRLANKLSRGLGCGWVVFYLASSIRIHLHAEVWIFRPFKVNSLQYVNRLLSRRSSRRGLGSAESRSCSASGRMNSLCHIHAQGRCTSLQRVQLLPGLVSPAHHALSSIPLSCPREGQEASHAMPGAVSGRPTARRYTEARSAFSLSSLPCFCSPWSSSELVCCKIPSLLLGSVEIGRWIQTVSWVADRQADRQHDCESFISVRNQAKNDSLSQGSLSSMSQTEVCKAEKKRYTDSNGY